MKKNLKPLLISLCALLLVLIISFIFLWCSFGRRVSGALSVKQLEKGLYSLEFTGDYGLDKLLESSNALSESKLTEFLKKTLSAKICYQPQIAKSFTSSSIVSKNGQILFGRNFDSSCGNVMLVHTKSSKGYESISTTCLSLFTSLDFLPDKNLSNKLTSLASIFFTLDGINEKGLYVACLNVNSDNVSIASTVAVRILLDKASTTNEAIKLLKNLDFNFSGVHFAIADESGNSKVVEYVDNQMVILDQSVATNHLLSPVQASTSDQTSVDRFNALSLSVTQSKNEGDVLNALKSDAQNGKNKTTWSIVYYPALKGADFYFMQNYDNPYALLFDFDFWLAN